MNDETRLRDLLQRAAGYLETATGIIEQDGGDEDDVSDSRALVAELRAEVARLSQPAPAQDRATRVEVRTLGDAWDDGVEAACEWFDVGASAPRLDALYKVNPYRTAERSGKDGTK